MQATAEPHTNRVPNRLRRQRKARELKYAVQARRHRPANAAADSLLLDPDYHMAKSCGWDVARKELRHREPPTRTCPYAPNPHYNPGDPEFLASADCAVWLWWKSMDANQRHGFYEASHEGEAPVGVPVLNIGLEITNPAIVVESW